MLRRSWADIWKHSGYEISATTSQAPGATYPCLASAASMASETLRNVALAVSIGQPGLSQAVEKSVQISWIFEGFRELYLLKSEAGARAK